MSSDMFFNVSQIIEVLNARLDYLDELIYEKSIAISAAPEGRLKIVERGSRNNKRDRLEYYWRAGQGEVYSKYLNKKDDAMIKVLAQKEYDQLAVGDALSEKEEIEKILAIYEARPVETTHNRMNRTLQTLSEPFMESDDEFLDNWLNQKFEPNPYHPEDKIYRVTDDLLVRSKGEQDIAIMLLIYGIPFFYEKPLTLFVDDRDVTIYPDFTILDVNNRREIYWEHMGMMDIPKYRESSLWKIKWFQLNGYAQGEDLIITMEDKREKLDLVLIQKIISHIAPDAKPRPGEWGRENFFS